jgi:rod shape-determining protein MreC
MSRNPSRLLLTLALLLLALSLILLSEGGLLRPAENALLRPLSSLQSFFSLRFQALRDLVQSPADMAALRARNQELEARVASLERQVIALREQLAETEILAALLNYARSQPESRYIAVHIIGRDINPFIRSAWINRGSDDGIRQGMPVITERGLVGRVQEVYPTTARVQLLTDPELAVNVLFLDSRAEGVLSAQLNGELWVDMIDQDREIRVGELVLTSGLGGNYPPEIPVGQVISVRRRDFAIFQQAVVQPAVDFDDLRIVLVITDFEPLPLESLP